MCRVGTLLEPWSGKSLAGPAESRPRGRPRSAYAVWGVEAVVACALAGIGVLRLQHHLGGGGDGRRAATGCYSLTVGSRAAHRRLEFN